MMANIYKTLRNNWKKSVLFSVAGSYGVNYGIDKYKERELMQAFCKEALGYGEMTQKITSKPYHVTVILNPAANGGRARNKFESFCEPLLHLAGLKVSIVRTESIGQAKEILELLEEPNAVLVAGGDGTVMEVVTGMIRRGDSNAFCTNVPVGVLPVGQNNFMAKTLFPPDEKNEKHADVLLMAEATMSVVRQFFRPIDVMEIENINEEDPSFHGKKLHGLRQVQLGAFRDSQARINNYWFLPGIKKYIAYIFAYTSAAKHIMWNTSGTVETRISEVNIPEDQCQKNQDLRSDTNSWWDYLTYYWPSNNANRNENMTNSSDPNLHSQTVQKWQPPLDCSNAIELTIQSDNDICLKKEKDTPSLKVTIGPELIGFKNFVTEGWKRQWNIASHFVSPTNEDKDNSWKSFSDLTSVRWNLPSRAIKNEGNLEDKVFYLDNEPIEIHGGMEVKLLPNKVRMFCAESLHIPHFSTDISQSELQKKWWQRKRGIQSKTSFAT